ncbi:MULTISPECIES: SMP-30/gluconolactonase/LRE family protein [unclassified Streptomyces]|nr:MULTISPECIES: SMP-30/gluconolactonase/LRE family protein [unclassified Streptomyces]NDZ98605.1 SMP-30/gluconolactonase/LRE family protein [Streptomyces sp. SID10116]MYY86992.1 SMP-30/gluconolactonase/LRE family protein [Streptomyces sp. SID335]MYZ18487.1 SMP-30/gluconolactonase/LRE family protein [Streptomyces sp. SID337]MYZ18602.1 SMP-30/gluconolactonase/LRE family protein [Streptomyces sp. SID337]NDZ84985.1 SMP-30/gluconolactonase/LRE family protein [Streptomyces sp. SID10115]
MSGNDSTSLYEILDERFRTGRCANGDDRLERLYGGCRWAEGPLYLPAWRQLVWSDIPNDRLLRWDESTGAVSVFRSPAGHVNGNTLDREGRLISCEQGNRRVTRTEPDGRITVLAERYEGKRLNSPNDAVVRSDGSVWFSDPDFGITSDYEGHRAEPEIDGLNVYRIDPSTGEVRLVADGFGAPNGLVFSPDERQLYVSDTRGGCIRVFDVREDGTLSDGKVFAEAKDDVSRFDNIRFDDGGRLWAAAIEGGVHCYDPDGTLIGRLRVPEPVSNITFGGPKNNRLFITATSSLYSLVMAVTGLPRVRR